MSAAGNVAVAGSATTTATKTVTITASGCGVQPWCYKPATLTVQRSAKVVWKNMTLTKAACKVSPGTGTDTNFASPAINPNKTIHSLSFTPEPTSTPASGMAMR